MSAHFELDEADDLSARRALRAAGPESRSSWTVEDALVVWAIGVVDSMELAEAVGAWRAQDRRGPGGAPETFPVRPIFVAMTICARLGRPMLATDYTNVLYRHISPEMRTVLGVADPPDRDDKKGWKATYRNVRTRVHALLEPVDPSPFPKNRRRTPEEFAAAMKPVSVEVMEVRYQRLHWLINAVLEASFLQLPPHIAEQWEGAVAVDSTPLDAFSRPERREPGRRKGRAVLRHAADPDAAWYIRTGDHRDVDLNVDGTYPRKMMWAHEVTLVTMAADRPSENQLYPNLVVGMAPVNKPGYDVGLNGVRALSSVVARSHPAGLLAADRAYASSKPEHFAFPVKALGYLQVIDYREDQLGVQGQHAGALLVEGAWHCPCTPQPLIDATIDHRAGVLDEPQWQARLEGRAPYRLRPKARPDQDGHGRKLCPAAGTAPTVRCELKPDSLRRSTLGLPRVQLDDITRNQPSKVCRQQSVTFPPDAGGRFAQHLPYGLPPWKNTYSALRNTIEGNNGHAKDEAFEGIGAPSRRRIRGTAATSLAVAFMIFGANLRKIDSFIDLCVIDEDGAHRPKRRPSIADHLPPVPMTGPTAE